MSPYVVESVRVEIAAPADFVWDVLVDYARYPEWNPYTVRAETTLEIGSPIALTLPNPDGSPGTFVNTEYIRVVDPPRHLRYDTAEEIPGVFAVRDQYVTPLGPSRCAYHTTDELGGTYGKAVFERQGPWVKSGFDSVAHAIKARAESLWLSRTA